MLDPNKAYISLSRTAGELLKRLGVVRESASEADIKNILCGAARDGDIKAVESSKEMHYLAEATLNDVHCFLLCVTNAGSPAGNREFTTIIKGVMLPADAKDLMSRNKGLAPIGRTLSVNRRKDD